MKKEFEEVYLELVEYAKEAGLNDEEIKEFFEENKWLLNAIRKLV
jgi:hypothetical protein